MKLNKDKIELLWDWFTKNESRIVNSIEFEIEAEQKYVVDQLDNLILDMGLFSWKIEPGHSKTWALTISPNGDKDLLVSSKKIVEMAPVVDSWEFNYFKQAKEWNRNFMIYDENMIERNIDATNWNFVTKKQSNGQVKLIMETHNINHLDQDTEMRAAEVAILNEIGEERKIKSIASVEVVDHLEKEDQPLKRNLKLLKEHC